jgi:4,5-DOPA dioxygenase extradiol
MNAIEENPFVQGFRAVAQTIPRPHAILCVSAHWETRGTRLTAMEHPRTIHDFGGFPDELYEVEYPAPGSPVLAREAKQLITGHPVDLDVHWGLDHGAWSVIKHLYPDADVPVVQMSLDRNMTPSDHYALATALQPLRDHGILVIGSGNMVHNLGMVDFRRMHEQYAYDWAQEAGDNMKRFMLDDDHRALMEFERQGAAFRLAIPTPEHYLPLLYTLALKQDKEPLSFFNDAPVAGSLTMTSVKVG